MNEHDIIVPVLTCEHCGNYVTAEAAEALNCPACLLLDEFGTLDIPWDVTASMSRRERQLVAVAFQSIPHYYDDQEENA